MEDNRKAYIRIASDIIEELIASGVLIVDKLDDPSSVKVERMWLEQKWAPLGEIGVVIRGNGLHATAQGSLIPRVKVEIATNRADESKQDDGPNFRPASCCGNCVFFNDGGALIHCEKHHFDTGELMLCDDFIDSGRGYEKWWRTIEKRSYQRDTNVGGGKILSGKDLTGGGELKWETVEVAAIGNKATYKEVKFDTRAYLVVNGSVSYVNSMVIVMSRSDAVDLSTSITNELGNPTEPIMVRLDGKLYA